MGCGHGGVAAVQTRPSTTRNGLTLSFTCECGTHARTHKVVECMGHDDEVPCSMRAINVT